MASILSEPPPGKIGQGDLPPVAESTMVASLAIPAEAAGGEAGKPLATPRTLLVVDDQPGVCASIAYLLEASGYRTFRAESGQAAIDLFSRELIDGVLLDVQMPRLNGFETGARLHEVARASDRPLKIWFMTGVHYRGLKDDCARAGGVSIFPKPFEWPRLLAELEQGLATPPQAARSDTDSAPIPT